MRVCIMCFMPMDLCQCQPPALTRREPMPKTIEYYEAQQEREGKLILEMKAEISDLKVRNDRLMNKLRIAKIKSMGQKRG